MSNELRNFAAQLMSGFAGQENALVIPRPYLTLCDNDHRAALLLSQCVYWSDRTDDPEGWFAKSYGDWLKELALSEYEVRRAAKALAAVGLETKLKKFGGAPVVHYRIDKAKFSESILKKLQNPSLSSFRNDPEETSESLTETTTETTLKEKNAPPAHPVSDDTQNSALSTDDTIVWVRGDLIEDDDSATPQLHPCTAADINALIGMWWEWVPKRPVKRGKVVDAKEHFANKANRDFAETLTRRGVVPADMAQFLGEIRYDPKTRYPHLVGKEMTFVYAAEVLQEWVEADRAENWYTPDAPRITPRKPGRVVDLSLIASSDNPLADFANHPDFIVDLPPAYISPHDLENTEDDLTDTYSADDATLLAEIGEPL